MPDIVAVLRSAGCVFAEDEARLLVAAAATPADLAALVAARVAGRPLEQVLGWAEFCGLRIALDPGVFVPRRRSEFLAKLAADRTCAGDVVVDLCCGSGAIGAAVLARVPTAQVWAGDIDPVATACARRNLPPHRVATGDLYDALPASLRGRVRVLVVNAPYVPTADLPLLPPEARLHEPALALDGGPDGLAIAARAVRDAPRWLAPGGQLLIETSAGQSEQLAGLMAQVGLGATVLIEDDLAAVVVTGGDGGTSARGGAAGVSARQEPAQVSGAVWPAKRARR